MVRTLTRGLLALSLLTISGLSPALADNIAERVARTLNVLDLDNDNQIDREELSLLLPLAKPGELNDIFKKFDRNHNGDLDRNEFRQFLEAHDKDFDGFDKRLANISHLKKKDWEIVRERKELEREQDELLRKMQAIKATRERLQREKRADELREQRELEERRERERKRQAELAEDRRRQEQKEREAAKRREEERKREADRKKNEQRKRMMQKEKNDNKKKNDDKKNGSPKLKINNN